MLKAIGNYEILKVIAEHGPTTICLARHKKLKRKTFLKIFKSADTSLLKRFEREAQIVAELNDPHIVSIYDFGEENGLYYIAMEYVKGGNLKEFLDSNPLSPEQKLELAYKITEAVAVLHKKNFIHRDLKPENILVDQNQNIKLTDFGIAFNEALHRMTTEGSLLGTPLYMSPEQINNLPLTPASDVFSLGIIFYQMVTGLHPFEATRIGEIFSQILTKKIDDLTSYSEKFPDWFLNLIQKMLEKEIDQRPGSTTEILNVFQKNLKIESSTSAQEEAEDEIKKVNVLFVLGTAAFVFILALFIWWFWNTEANNPANEPKTSLVDSLVTTPLDTSQVLTINNNANQAQLPSSETNVDHKLPETNHDISNNELQLSTVMIKTNPWCRVFLNYQLVDSTPMLKPLKLKPGEYVLGLQNPMFPIYTQKIKVEAGKNNEFEFKLDSLFSKLDLQVLPWGDVYIDGKYLGKTPLQKPIYVTREKHILEIKNDYYGTYSDTIDFSRKGRVQKLIALKDLKK